MTDEVKPAEKSVKDDINEMLDALEGTKKVEKVEDGEEELAKMAADKAAEKAAEKGKKDEKSADEKKDEEPPAKDKKEVEEKKGESSTKNETPSDSAKDEDDERKNEDEAEVADDKEGTEGDKEDDVSFRAAMNSMAAEMLKKQSPVVETKTAEPVKAAVEEKKEAVNIPISLDTLQITEREYEDAMASPEKFNELVMRKAATYVESRVQEMQRRFAASNAQMVQQMVDIRIAASDFYLANPGLREFKPFVGMVANEVFAKNPDKELDDLFNITGKEVRKRLKLQKGGDATQGVEKKRTPAVVDKSRASTRKPEPPKLTGQEADIAAMLEYDNRH